MGGGCEQLANPEAPTPLTKYKVTYVSEKGSAPTAIEVAENSFLTDSQLKLLDDEGDYFCIGWFDGETEAVAGKYKVTKDVTLKAKWQKTGPVADVTFTPSAGEIDYKDSITLNCVTPKSKIFYKFDDGEFVEYKNGTEISIEKAATITAYATAEKMINSKQVPANYTIKTYTVTFTTEKGSAPAQIKGLKKNDILIKEHLNTIPDDGEFMCTGWLCNGVKVNPGYKITKDITLTAKWDPWPIVEKVEFITKAGEVDYNKPIYLYCSTPNATIHYKCGDGAEQIYDSNKPFKITKDITITAYATAERMKKGEDSVAKYTVKKYKVNFNIENKPEGLKDPECDFVVLGGTTANPNVYFDGKIVHWYKEDGSQWDFANDKIGTSDITITGKLEYFTVEEVKKYFKDNKGKIPPLTPVHIEYTKSEDFNGFQQQCTIPQNLNIYIYAKNPGTAFPQCIFQIDSNGTLGTYTTIPINEFHIMGDNITLSWVEPPFFSLQIKKLYIESPIKDFLTLYGQYGDGSSLEYVQFPNTLEILGDFMGCPNLKTITIPRRVKSFCYYNFTYDNKDNCAFESIIFEDTTSKWKPSNLEGEWTPFENPAENIKYFKEHKDTIFTKIDSVNNL